MNDELQTLLRNHAPEPPAASSSLEARIWQHLQTEKKETLNWRQLLTGLLPLAAALLLMIHAIQAAPPANEPVEPFVYELGVELMRGDSEIEDTVDYADEIIEWTGI